MDTIRNIRVVAAVIEVNGEVMLVRQQGPMDPAAMWTLPGGRVEPGESLTEALAREVLEETGLTLNPETVSLLYVTETMDAHDATHWVAFVFRADVHAETAPISDPDGLILEARFMSVEDAIAACNDNPHAPMREPTTSYLRGEGITFWSYTISALGRVERLLPCRD